ncbi:MAG TPA: site-2 protease family protein [Candidatus Limnocylindrales bacterium]|nr:site-2 protease family protein [Candidatus Limnocylindrales bacterium]
MNGIPVARLFGFEIRIHPSWIFIVAVVAVIVERQVREISTGLDPVTGWLVGAVTAGAFLLSVLAHELAHGIVARRRGIDVGPITLYFFGGSASFQLESDRPRDEAAIALAGPVVSLAIGLVLVLVAFLADATGHPVGQAAAIIALVLAVLNLILGGANLIPAYPLDGGRLVRAAVWARKNDEREGARAAAASGRYVGWALVGAGLLLILMDDVVDGLMLGLSGWFLGGASRGIMRRLAVQELLKDVRVADVMDKEVGSVAPHLTVDTFADRLLEGGDGVAMPVLQDEAVVGLIGASQLRRLRRKAWETTRAEDLMVAPPTLPLVGPEDTLWSALDRLRRTGLDGLPVVEGVRLLGVVTRQAIVATIQSRARTEGVSLR